MSTAASKSSRPAKRVYKKISLKARSQLVQKVISQGLTISKAASTLKIALSTAKLIVKRYRQTGTFFLRRGDEKRVEKSLGNSQNEGQVLFGTNEVACPTNNQTPIEEIRAEQVEATMEPMIPVIYCWEPIVLPLAPLEWYYWGIY